MASTLSITMTVNGAEHVLDLFAHHTLLDVLRNELQLIGSKECCSAGECGACTVLVDGRGVNSCLMLAVEADGSEITTVEGLAEDGILSPLQEAFLDKSAAQCGFCIPGQLMAAQALLNRNPHPTPDDVREGLVGNLCRCAGYEQITQAVLAAGEVTQ